MTRIQTLATRIAFGSLAGVALAANALADGKGPIESRFFVSNYTTSPSQLNTELTTRSLNNFSNIGSVGFEVDYSFAANLLLIGARVEARYGKVLETASVSAVPSNPYFSSIQQSTGEAVLRANLIDNSSLKLDLMGSIGSSSTEVDVRSSAGEGAYTANNNSTLITKYGASAGVGLFGVLVFAEAGYETNLTYGATKTGTTSSSINHFDLSGNYVSVGLLFNGLPAGVHSTSSAPAAKSK